MLRVVKKLFLLCLVVGALYANELEDAAYNAYKSKNYIEAVKLYTQAAKQNSIKAFLMLGLFYEKGIGVDKNPQKAVKLYKMAVKKSGNLISLLNSKEGIKKLDIVILSLERLNILTSKKKYLDLADKLKTLKDKKLTPQNTDMFNQTDTEKEDDILVLCPNMQKVAPQDREGIESFDCELFENFPDRMAIFMKLRRKKFEAQQNGDSNLEKLIDAKIAKIIKPIIKFLQQESIECYSEATTSSDIDACDYDYLAKSDPLLFDNAAYRMEQNLSRGGKVVYNLSPKEKEDLINKLIEKISNNQYGRPWRNYIALNL